MASSLINRLIEKLHAYQYFILDDSRIFIAYYHDLRRREFLYLVEDISENPIYTYVSSNSLAITDTFNFKVSRQSESGVAVKYVRDVESVLSFIDPK